MLGAPLVAPLVTRELLDDPYPVWARLRRDAPVWQLPGANAYLVSTWPLVAEATSRVEDFSNHFRYTLFTHPDGTLGAVESGGAAPDVFAGADPPTHTAHRKIFGPPLTQTKFGRLEPDVTALADALLDPLLAAGQGDAAVDLAQPLPLQVVAERVIGFRGPDLDQLQQWVAAGSRLMGGLLSLEEMVDLSGRVAGMWPWTVAQLDGALAQPESPAGASMLEATAAAVTHGELTRDEAAFTLMVLIGAGAETTTSLIGIAVGLLAERPALQAELRLDTSKVAAFIEEVLRYESPFRYHPRTATRDTQLGGVEIPRGALLLLLWASANRDEAVFERADELIVGRHNAHLHYGFGRGIHHCVGAPLARLEARVVVTRLLARTASFAPDRRRPPEWSEGIWIHRHEHLPIVLAS